MPVHSNLPGDSLGPMAGMDTAELLRHVSVLVFTPTGTVRCERTRHYQVHVTWRYEGKWSVTTTGSAWNGQEWDLDFRDRTLFPLEEAVAAAKSLVDTIEVDGFTWAQGEALRKARTEN